MSCSKTSTVNYLIDKKLVKPNMELYSSLPTTRLSDTIDRLTKIAKAKYGVDMGSLFNLKFRNVQVGNYLIEGSRSVQTKALLEANEAAFEAIDRSPYQNELKMQQDLDNHRFAVLGTVNKESEEIDRKGNYIVSSGGEIVVPASLPLINLQC